MRLSRLVAQAEAPREELVAPSPAHERFVALMGDLAGMMGNSHPAAKILKRLLPSLLKDLVELDEGLLRRACGDLAIGLRSVAEAPYDAASVDTTIEVDASEEPELTPARPVELALPTGQGG
jgi:hypothetical protein